MTRNSFYSSHEPTPLLDEIQRAERWRADFNARTRLSRGRDLGAHARRSDPKTSHQAAASVKNQETLRARVLETLRDCGPLSDESLALKLFLRYPTPYSPSGIRTRRSELVAMGDVADSGKRERSKANRESIVWECA